MTDTVERRVALEVGDRLDDHVASVVHLASIRSGSHDPAGVARVADTLADLVDGLADVVETRSVPPAREVTDEGTLVDRPLGPALVATRRPDAPVQVLVFGHLDTVFGPGHPFDSVRRTADVLAGPGVADCKGGLVAAVAALAALDHHPDARNVGWRLVAVPDEEIGSPGSKALLADAARGAHIGIGVEPALVSGAVARARKGSLTFHLVFEGRAAHVGRAHGEGVSAIAAAARVVGALEELNDHRRGVTVNVGRIHGGGPLNVVPDRAVLGVNVRVAGPDDEAWVRERIDRALALAAPAEVEMVAGGYRPPKVVDDAIGHLLAHLRASADALGVVVGAEDTGGCCDGNDLAALGLANIDSLGLRGGGIHSEAEFAEIDSLPERAGLMAGVIVRAAADPLLTTGTRATDTRATGTRAADTPAPGGPR